MNTCDCGESRPYMKILRSTACLALLLGAAVVPTRAHAMTPPPDQHPAPGNGNITEPVLLEKRADTSPLLATHDERIAITNGQVRQIEELQAENQRLTEIVRKLQAERRQLEGEVRRLEAECRRLNDTIEKIRSAAGNPGYHPS